MMVRHWLPFHISTLPPSPTAAVTTKTLPLVLAATGWKHSNSASPGPPPKPLQVPSTPGHAPAAISGARMAPILPRVARR